MRAARYLSIGLLSIAIAVGITRLDTSATPQVAAPAATLEASNVVNASVRQETKPAATSGAKSDGKVRRHNPEWESFYITMKLSEKKYKWGESTPRVKLFQRMLKVPKSGHYDHNTLHAHRGWVTFFGGSTDHLPKPPLPKSGEVPGAGQRCPQYEPIALAVGWPAEQIPKLSYVMWRESRCLPTAHNPRPPDNSYGLIQLNMLAHKGWVGPIVGWDFNQLFDPYVNLRVGLQLWHKAGGWGPWAV